MADVSEYGYGCVALQAGSGYNFVFVGQVVQDGDQEYDKWQGWVSAERRVGQIVTKNSEPVRRPIKNKWSCSHGKDPGDKFCVVCAAFMRHVQD
jgi:hypothetical protein